MSDGNGALPEGWAEVNVEEVCDDTRTGLVRSVKEQSEDRGFPYVRMGEYDKNGRWTFEQLTRVDATEEDAATYDLRAGDVLFNTRNSAELVGKVAIWPDGRDGYVYNNNLLRLRFPPEIISRFVGIQMQAPDFVASLDEVKSATTNVAALYQRDLKTRPLRIAPLAEQRRIVSKIESLQERSSRARRALSEVGPLLEQFRQSVLRAAFSGRLTADWRAAHRDVEPATELLSRIRTERRHRWEQSELAKYEAKGKQPPKNWQDKYKEPQPLQADELEILHDQSLPEGWLWAPAELIVEPEAEIVYGIVQPGKKLDEGVPYVRGKDIVDGVILVDQLLKTSEKIAAKYERASLMGGDVLLGIIRATKVAIVPDVLEGANITQGTARFRPSSIIRTKFLAGWLDSPSAQNWLHDHYRGIDMPGLNLRDVRRLPVPIAPLAEQEALESQIATAIESVANAKEQAAESESSLTQLDQSILAKAFRGELVPQDPRDEPASELLARIRTTRDAIPLKKKTARKRTKKGKQS